MTLTEARKILGLGPDEDPRPHLSEFQAARERIAEMVRTAPNETLGDRYQNGLVEFDQALAAVREILEGHDPERTADPGSRGNGTRVTEPRIRRHRRNHGSAQPDVRRGSPGCSSFLSVLPEAGFLYFKNEERQGTRSVRLRIAFLERMGSEFVENRRWQEAATSFAEIETLAPGSELANSAAAASRPA